MSTSESYPLTHIHVTIFLNYTNKHEGGKKMSDSTRNPLSSPWWRQPGSQHKINNYGSCTYLIGFQSSPDKRTSLIYQRLTKFPQLMLACCLHVQQMQSNRTITFLWTCKVPYQTKSEEKILSYPYYVEILKEILRFTTKMWSIFPWTISQLIQMCP